MGKKSRTLKTKTQLISTKVHQSPKLCALPDCGKRSHTRSCCLGCKKEVCVSCTMHKAQVRGENKIIFNCPLCRTTGLIDNWRDEDEPWEFINLMILNFRLSLARVHARVGGLTKRFELKDLNSLEFKIPSEEDPSEHFTIELKKKR